MDHKPPYELITFPSSDTKNGVLYMFQEVPDALPFTPKRVLITKGMNGNDRRGAHTHYETNQILVAISGGCTVELDDGEHKEDVVLTTPNQGLLLYPYVWHVMHTFLPDTTLMVIADRTYDEKDYIRSYEDFKRIVAEKKV
ncbi:MAG TPA: FdtA/QdtA family cupin domain-containing protein [Candidatus Paceibacterota bacterium]|nr:FdtA/QdtA family cupin domain-containing protein [Candidatus Paceibacterota bacterium]